LKKEAKTLAPALSSPDANLLQLARRQKGKSFFGSFFQKRTLPSRCSWRKAKNSNLNPTGRPSSGTPIDLRDGQSGC
jgi:hypothetical protein